jgi:centrosomal protein CEP104
MYTDVVIISCRFRVVYHTSEDVGYPVEELNSHTPQTRGWKSAKFCDYPQELGFEFLGSANNGVTLQQVQILSHQALISTRIDVYIASAAPSYQLARFTKLGFLTLNSNERAGFQARELKTVHVNSQGQYIKFVCHRNHENQYNPQSQIGIVAVNFLGFDDESTSANLGYAEDINFSSLDNQRNALNDLSVDMNLDSQTASKLRLLAEAKTRAIADEDYLTAKDIKAVENDLRILGSQLAQLDLAKREAVRAEDFDRAKEIKDDCDKIRREIEHRVSTVYVAVNIFPCQ